MAVMKPSAINSFSLCTYELYSSTLENILSEIVFLRLQVSAIVYVTIVIYSIAGNFQPECWSHLDLHMDDTALKITRTVYFI